MPERLVNMDQIQLKHKGSLILVQEVNGPDTCLGFLIYSPEHGVFDAHYGRVDVTKEEADIHNKLLSTALIEGLDRCEVGQCGDFYLHNKSAVRTWTGEVVAESSTPGKRGCRQFVRNGRTFEFKVPKDEDCITVKRIK
jgi:hypothetical protein